MISGTEDPPGGPGRSEDGATASSPTSTLRVATPPHLQKQLGRYELLEVLGHGAMATVFRARDTQLARQVAVKVMNLAVAARSDSAERFRREAQAVAAIKHPGIVEVFDFVAARDHEPAYIVSELIEGPTLKSWLDRRSGRVLPEIAALLAHSLAEALAVAHSRGVVHRDVKPDNVMLDRSGGGCRVVLTDFGVAHVTGLETMTATGALVGSPAYMSPEQARGHEVGPQSDVWAAGVLLYEMATGHLPFTGRDPLMVVGAIMRGLYRRPSQVSPYVSTVFDEICARCLQPTSERRYAGAKELAADLRAYCLEAGLDPGGESLRAWMQDHERFEAELRGRSADKAVTSARKHARRGEFARALTELSRATAYVPKHAEADRLIAKISSRRRWLKLGAVAAAIVAVGAGMMVLAPRLTTPQRPLPAAGSGHERGVPPPVTPSPAGPGQPAVAEKPAAPGVVAAGEPGGPPAAAEPGAGGDPASGPGRRRRRPGSRVAAPAKAGPASGVASAEAAGAPGPGPDDQREEAATAAAAPAGGEAVASAPAVVTPSPAATEPAAGPVAVEILAAQAFCKPSLDERPASESPVRLRNVVPGSHQLFCTKPNRVKRFVGDLTIPGGKPGQVFRIQIVRQAPDDTPVLDAGRTRLMP